MALVGESGSGKTTLARAVVSLQAISAGSARFDGKAVAGRDGFARLRRDRYPHELSGGQARRVGVARALALQPRLMIADEATAGLDVPVQAEVLNLMADLRRDMGLGYLIITHNLAVMRHVADRIVVLYLGRAVDVGPTAEVFAAPAPLHRQPDRR